MSFWQWIKSIFVSTPAQVIPLPVKPKPEVPMDAPWMQWMKDHIGETFKTGYEPTDFNRMCFSHTDYGPLGNILPPGCAATVSAALELSGYHSAHSASAISYKDFGKPCEAKFGAILVLEHIVGPLKGHHHVTFLYEVKTPELYDCLGGNQNHLLQHAMYGIGSSVKVIGCRWPIV